MPEVLHNFKLNFQIMEDLFCFHLPIIVVSALYTPLGLLSLSFEIENHYLTGSIPTSICCTEKIIVCRWAVSVWVYVYIDNRICNRAKDIICLILFILQNIEIMQSISKPHNILSLVLQKCLCCSSIDCMNTNVLMSHEAIKIASGVTFRTVKLRTMSVLRTYLT